MKSFNFRLMANDYFRFKQFIIHQDRCAFKVGTDGVLLGALADISDSGQLLDVGTGTGLIAIMAAQRSHCRIVAIEPHRESFLQACENVAACPFNERIKVENLSFRDYFINTHTKFDFIVTNPPYFRNSLRNPDRSKSMTRHADSLIPEDLLEGTLSLLSENGSLQVILPYSEGSVFIATAAEEKLYCTKIIKIRAIPSAPVIRMILKFEKSKKRVQEKFLTIETGIHHKYTDEYIEATKDFYLKF